MPMLDVRILLIWTGSPASIICPSPTTMATCPCHTTRSPGSSWLWSGTDAPIAWAAECRGRLRPASAYAHEVRPLQSVPDGGFDAPHTYGVPRAVRALRTAAAATSFGASTEAPPGRLIPTPLPGCGGIATGRCGPTAVPPPPLPPPP